MNEFVKVEANVTFEVKQKGTHTQIEEVKEDGVITTREESNG